MTRDIRAVPKRTFGNLFAVSDEMLQIMQAEMTIELFRLHEDVWELGKQRNGLAHIKEELRLREL